MLALTGAACKQTPVRTAQNGVLDLRGQKWTLQGFLLAGEWLFAPQHFSSPERESFSGENIRPMLVPGGWNGRTPGQSGLPADGYGTYFLRVLLEPAARPVSLYLPNVHSAYRLHINGKLVAGVGQPGKNAAESVPQLFPLAIELPDTPAELFVVVQVSNFHHRNGGLWKAPVLMEGRAALTGWRIDLAASWGEFGLYVGMALLFLALYLSMRRQPELIYFSLLCLLTALRAVLTGQRSLVYLFPDLPFHVNYALEYITFIATPSAMAGMFYFHFFAQRKLLFFIPLCLLQAISALLLAVVLFTPARTYTEIFPLATTLMFANAGELALARQFSERSAGMDAGDWYRLESERLLGVLDN
ncbi:MAG: 7TM-DISM domain-containing protein, partial [Spirochaetes bacterium]|nr:7TM-DISM domain-containing protein [Spirochaetota bacterium]